MRASPEAPTGPRRGRPAADPDRPRALIIGCGALARELVEITARPGFEHVEVSCLAATLHNRPVDIPSAVRRKIREARGQYESIFVAYADCGTGGMLDRVLDEEGVERLAGSHCYEFYAGREAFARLADEEPGTFYLTDFLARHFDRLVIHGLGLDRHPELLPTYFGNYRRLVYLSQTDDRDLLDLARRAADRLGLTFAHRRAGLGELEASVADFGRRTATALVADPAGPSSPASQDAGPIWPLLADGEVV